MQLFAAILTVINFLLMTFLVTQRRPAKAHQALAGSPQVLHGSGLEIVDGQGRIRASVTLVSDNGVVLRLSVIKGKPLVKMGAADNGVGLNLLDGTDDGVVINARRAGTYVKVTNQGRKTLSLPKLEK